MIFGLSWGFVFGIIAIAFFCEYVDSTLGMGYGTTMTPLLLMMGFSPMQIVPAILLSELITGVTAGFFHHKEGNVDLRPRFKGKMPLHLKVALVLFSCSIFGAVIAVGVANVIPRLWLKAYIGVLVTSMGIVILVFLKKNFKFSWSSISALGFVASFNKGLTGGGYGPLIASGQILSGVSSKSAIGITSLAEGLTCIVGVVAYLILSKTQIDWRLAPLIITGAVISVPLSAKSVKKMEAEKLKLIIGILTIFLGVFTLINTFAK